MESVVPSGPKPTKEAYLTTLRILRENHKVADDGTAGGSNRRAQLFTGEEVRVTGTSTAGEPSTNPLDPPNSFLANIALGGRAERRNIPLVKTDLPIEELATNTTPTKATASSKAATSPASAKTPTNSSIVGVSEKFRRSSMMPAPQAPRLSDGSDQAIKFGRKATRRFTIVSNLLPKYRIDDKVKQKIAAALKDINCWSDDEDYEAVKKLRAIEEDSDLSSDSESEFSLEALASQKHPPKSMKGVGNTLVQSNLVSTKYRGFQAQASAKTPAIQETAPQPSVKERPDLVRPKHTIIQTKQQSAKHAYLEQQKELQRQQAKELIVKKAVKLIVKLRAEEEAQQQRSLLAISNNLSTLVRLSIESIAIARVNKITKQGIALAVERRIKLDRRAKRRRARENRASSDIFRYYRKYRVRMLLFCVVNYIRAKALYFKNQEIQEEREYRMRAAMRRVREDIQFKEWKSEQAVKSTFPVKPPPSEFAPIIAFTRKNLLCNNPQPIPVAQTATVTEEEDASEPAPTVDPAIANISVIVPKNTTFMTEASESGSVSSPRPPSNSPAKKSPRIQHPSPSPPSSSAAVAVDARAAFTTAVTSPRAGSAASAASTAASAAVLSVPGTATAAVVIKSAEQLREEREFQYHRPDLAPFSTMINNMALRSSSLFRSAPSAQPSWVDIASVSADYGKQFNSTANTAAKKLKSPAYAALEKFCGVTQEDLERRKIMKSKDLVNLKLKSFGHSIVSL